MPKCTSNGFIPCPLSWDGTMFPEFLSPRGSLLVSAMRGFLHQIWKKEVKWQHHIVCSLCGSQHPSLRFKSPFGWDGSAPDLSFLSSRHSLTSASLSPGQSAYQLQDWRHQLSLQVTPWGTKPGSDEEDASSSSPRLVPAFLTSWSSSFPFQPPIWPTPVNSGWTADRNNRPHRPPPSYHPCGNSPLYNKSVCLAHTSCPGQALADIASTVMDQLLLCAEGGTITEPGSSAWHAARQMLTCQGLQQSMYSQGSQMRRPKNTSHVPLRRWRVQGT